DASPAKQGLRMPGTDIPIVGPDHLAHRQPDAVLLFVSDLQAEVRAAFGDVEASGGQWVDAQLIGSSHAVGSSDLEQGAQPLDAAATSGTDAADGQSELV